MKSIKNFTLNFKDNNFNFKDFPISKVNSFESWSDDFKQKNSCTFKEELNSYNFRSDNFKNNSKPHILFNGCSNTFGLGLYKNEMWSKIVYDKINHNSGYFNLSVPGTGIIDQIVNFFKYFNTYGNPDVIFFNIPNLERFYTYENNVVINSEYDRDSLPILQLISYQYYLMLEQYCKSNNINLFSFSWSPETEKFMSFYFKNTFYKINNKDMYEKIYQYKNKSNEDFLIVARDGDHFGIGYNLYWANFIYNKYLGSNKSDNSWSK
jgi:hypothetical protein